MSRLYCIGFLIALIGVLGAQASAGSGSPRTLLVDGTVLTRGRVAYEAADRRILPTVRRLLRDAERALEVRPVSVVDKKQVPPSGDKHDYMSMGRYWWPDPSQPDGRPYVRRDGQSNPEAEVITDHAELSLLVKAVSTLALAHFFSGDERYAEHAVLLLRTWFLETETRMNPHLRYAQSIPGRTEGRGAGIVDAHLLPEIIDAVVLLGNSRVWTTRDQQEIEGWFTAYLQWLRESDHGQREKAARNNHGTWYDVQVSAIALFVGDTSVAAATLRDAQARRIAAQIAPDGSQPAELERTKSWDYTVFNLAALFRLAALGSLVSVDLWNYQTPDGRSIRKAVDWLLPYVSGDKQWGYEQIAERKTAGLAPLLLQAAIIWGSAGYRVALEKVQGFRPETDRSLLYLGLWEQDDVSAPSPSLHRSKGKP